MCLWIYEVCHGFVNKLTIFLLFRLLQQLKDGEGTADESMGKRRRSSEEEVSTLEKSSNKKIEWGSMRGEKFEWGKMPFNVHCCKEAFSAKNDCKFALCPTCHEEIQEDYQNKKTNKRSSRRKIHDSAATVTEKERKKNTGRKCGEHSYADYNTMNNTMSDRAYLAERRTADEGCEKIATGCVKCGVVF